MHLEGGFTRLTMTRYGGFSEVPTAAIPLYLRAIGSELLVVLPRFTPEDHDTVDDICHMLDHVEVHTLTADAVFTNW